MTVVSPYFTFPRISWWRDVIAAGVVVFDPYEHFQKMTDRNRYMISGANNSIKLSVPLVNGRNQRVPMGEVLIFNEERWQVQHWRTLVSVYKRTPFFDFYEQGLQPLFETRYTRLIDFNFAALHWVKKQMNLNFEEKIAAGFVKDYPDEVADLRFRASVAQPMQRYYQVFEDRIGFVADLSILDLLFSEGPRAIELLKPQPR